MTGWTDTFHKANMLACRAVNSFTAEQVRDLMDHAASLTGRAKSAMAFKDAIWTLDKAEKELQQAVEDINRKLKEGKKLAAHAAAGCEIKSAIEVLNTWDPQGNSGTSSADAAKAFDRLFGGVASFMHYLPAPLDQYEAVFKDIGKYGFFSNMRDLLTHGPGTSGDRVLREAEKESGMILR